MSKWWLIATLLIALFGKIGSAQDLRKEPDDTIHGKISWYSQEACQYNPDPACPTASGHSLYGLEARGVRFAAAWDYPFGTELEVCSDDTGRCVSVIVLDRGPAKRLNRVIDLSKAAFGDIADTSAGIIEGTVRRT